MPADTFDPHCFYCREINYETLCFHARIGRIVRCMSCFCTRLWPADYPRGEAI